MSYIRLSNEKKHSAFSRLQNTLKYHVFFFSAVPLFRPAGSGKSPSFPFDRSMTTLSPRCDPQTLSFTIRPFRSPPSPLHDTRRTPRRAPTKTPLPPPSCRQRQDPLRPRRQPDPPERPTAAGPGGTVAENRIGERKNKEETDGKKTARKRAPSPAAREGKRGTKGFGGPRNREKRPAARGAAFEMRRTGFPRCAAAHGRGGTVMDTSAVRPAAHGKAACRRTVLRTNGGHG